MTGDKKIDGERVIVSPRLMAPESYCCRDVDLVAKTFLQSVNASRIQERLSADIAIKALEGMSAFGKKPTYEDTDNRKRDFTGDLEPGVIADEMNNRWNPSKTYEPGDKLVIFPSYESRESISNKPNFGWIRPPESSPRSFDELIRKLEKRPHIQLTRYDVDPKTDDVIEESAKIIDPLSITSGMTADERRKALAKYSQVNTKRLPGRTIGERFPGGSIIGRVAAAFGIIRDAQNKFRCPPGTPAANQFTDAFGTNCFGFSPTRFARFAARQAAQATEDGAFSKLQNRAEKFFDFLYNDRWGVDEAGSDPARLARNAFYDSLHGDRFKPPDWATIDVPPEMRRFKNGAIEAMSRDAELARNIRELGDALGIVTTDEERATNADVHKILAALRQISDASSGEQGWDIKIINKTNGRQGDSAPLTPEEVRRFVTARIANIPGVQTLSAEERERLIKADTARYYEIERALLETFVGQFLENPAMARKQLQQLEYDFNSGDEAGTGIIIAPGRKIPLIDPETGEQVLNPETGEPAWIDAGSTGFSQFSGVIHMNMEQIMSNTETMLPKLLPNQRLAVSAVGAATDAEARLAVADFIMNSSYAARHVAGLVNGPRSFARHIALHEWAHSVQQMAFLYAVQNKIRTDGFIDMPRYDKRGNVSFTRITDIRQLNNADLARLMQDVADNVNVADIKNAMESIKDVAPLAGNYPALSTREGSEVWALEAAAELWALREAGLIYGEDIDKALEWMDDVEAQSAEEDAVRRAGLVKRLRGLYGVDDDSIDPADPTDVGDIAPDDLDAMEADAIAREVASRRDELDVFEADFAAFDEEEMFEEAAIIGAQIDSARARLKSAEDAARSGGPDAGDIARIEINKARRDIDFYEEKYKRAGKAWRKKYGIGARSEMDRFEENVTAIRRSRGMYEPEELDRIAREAHLDDLRDGMSKLSPDDIVKKIVDHKILMSRMDKTSPEVVKAAEELDIMKGAYIESLRSSGDSRTRARIGKELDEKIEAILHPAPREARIFDTADDAKDMAKRERASIARKLTPEQRKAIVEAGDFQSSDIIQFIDSPQAVRRGRAINRRNARLKRLGLPVDTASAEEAALDDQVKNILIPVLESMEVSRAREPMDVEAVVEFAPRAFEGKAVGKEIDIEQFVTGRVITDETVPTRIPRGEVADRETWRRKRRVIIQVNEGDRGLFPKAGKDAEQSFVMPPGRLRVVGRDSDGTIRAEFVSQKSTDEVLGTMLNAIESGDDDVIWRRGQRRRVGTVVSKYTSGRLSSGRTMDGGRDRSGEEIRSTNRDVLGSLIDSGGSFGESFDEFSLGDESVLDEIDTDPLRGRLFDEADEYLDSLFGGFTNRQSRARLRQQRFENGIKEVDRTLLPGGSLAGSEQIQKQIEDAAFVHHMGLDRKVRVRINDTELRKLGETGSIRYGQSAQPDSGMSRRMASRIRSAEAGRLSSGKTSPVPTTVEERKKRVQLTAERAAGVWSEISNKLIELSDRQPAGGKLLTFDDLTQEQIDEILKDLPSVKILPQKSIGMNSERIYKTDDVPTALALMMHGHHVEIKSGGTILTQQSQEELEKIVERSAKDLISTESRPWREWRDAEIEKIDGWADKTDSEKAALIKELEDNFVDKFQADLCKLYSPETNIFCSEHLGIKREDMPQVNGRSLGSSTMAIRMLKDGRAAGKWEAKKGDISEPPSSFVVRYKDKIDAEIAKETTKQIGKGKLKPGEELSENQKRAVIHAVMGEVHNVRNDNDPAKTQQIMRGNTESGFASLSTEEKEWLYANANWQNTEVNLESQFIDYLRQTIKTDDGRNAVIRKSVKMEDLSPSQMELVGSKVDETNQQILDEVDKTLETLKAEGLSPGTPEYIARYREIMNKQWFMQPILTTSDGYILDGHHRAIGITVANQVLSQRGLELEIQVNEVQTNIIEALTLGKVFQDHWGIKEARLGIERKFEGDASSITSINEEDINASMLQLVNDTPLRVDEKYAKGTYVNPKSIGLSVRQSYRDQQVGRKNTASERQIERMLEQQFARGERAPAFAVGGRLSSGATGRRTTGQTRSPIIDESTGRTMGSSYADIDFIINDDGPRQRGTDRGLGNEYKVNPNDDAIKALVREYNQRIGIPKNSDDSNRPVVGYVVHGSQLAQKRKDALKAGRGNVNDDAIFEIGDKDIVGDGLSAFGEIELVLHPSVANRTAYGRGMSARSSHRPVLLNSTNKDDVSDALLNFDGPDGKQNTINAITGFSRSIETGNRSKMNQVIGKNGDDDITHDVLRAQILGGFDKDEIVQVNYPFSKISEMADNEDISDIVNNKTIASRLRAAGFSQEEIEYFYSMGLGNKITTESMLALRRYRTAKRVEKELNDIGFPNVKFAHPDGININDPRSYRKNASPSDKVEKILNQNIAREIKEEAEKLLKEMRKPGIPQLVGRSA